MENSEASSFSKPQTGGIAVDRLKSFIERVERLEVNKAQVQEYIKDVFSEAKASGFDPKVICVRLLECANKMLKNWLKRKQFWIFIKVLLEWKSEENGKKALAYYINIPDNSDCQVMR